MLLHAPAGYGKTSLLARLAARGAAAGPLVWMTCDEDDDPPRFLAGLLTALDPLDLPWRVPPEALCGLLAQPGGRTEVTGHLVNALAAVDAAHATLVLNDLHRIADPAVLAWVDAWLERLPERWTLVVAARSEPALPRLRTRGELAEFGAAELGFTAEETAAIVTGAGWEAATAAAFHARTQRAGPPACAWP